MQGRSSSVRWSRRVRAGCRHGGGSDSVLERPRATLPSRRRRATRSSPYRRGSSPTMRSFWRSRRGRHIRGQSGESQSAPLSLARSSQSLRRLRHRSDSPYRAARSDLSRFGAHITALVRPRRATQSKLSLPWRPVWHPGRSRRTRDSLRDRRFRCERFLDERMSRFGRTHLFTPSARSTTRHSHCRRSASLSASDSASS